MDTPQYFVGKKVVTIAMSLYLNVALVPAMGIFGVFAD